MHTPLVMTVIGRDRLGLVDLLSTLIAKHGGNWLDSRMSHLGGQFAGILRILVPQDQEQALVAALKELESKGLTVVVQADDAPAAPPASAPAVIEIVGQDRPGIIRQISNALARHQANVEELNSECSSAAMSGETLFRAQVKLHIPDTADVPALRQDLERIAEDLLVDISFERMPTTDPAG